jgi:voltage-gated potassium channel
VLARLDERPVVLLLFVAASDVPPGHGPERGLGLGVAGSVASSGSGTLVDLEGQPDRAGPVLGFEFSPTSVPHTVVVHELWLFTSRRWRSNLRDHTVVVGFGTKGRSAIQAVCATGLKADQVVVVDPSGKVIEAATALGFAGVVGDATRSDVLLRAEVQRARQIIVATQRDDTAVLVTLTARQLNRAAKIVAAVREEENAPLLRQSGADAVITSAGAAGRLLGLSVLSPSAGMVMEDLIQQGSGLDLVERPVIKAEVGLKVRETEDLIVSVVRGHRVLGYDDRAIGTLQLTDRLITIVRATPGTQPVPDTRRLPQD